MPNFGSLLAAASGIEHIETLAITGSAVQDADFVTTLNGNTDKYYLITGEFVVGANFAEIYLQPNQLSTNQFSMWMNGNGSTVTSSSGTGAMTLGLGSATANGMCSFVSFFSAKTGTRRGGITLLYGVNAAFSAGIMQMVGNQWNDTTTNITKLRIHGDRANAIGVGSSFRLYRILES